MPERGNVSLASTLSLGRKTTCSVSTTGSSRSSYPLPKGIGNERRTTMLPELPSKIYFIKFLRDFFNKQGINMSLLEAKNLAEWVLDQQINVETQRANYIANRMQDIRYALREGRYLTELINEVEQGLINWRPRHHSLIEAYWANEQIQ